MPPWRQRAESGGEPDAVKEGLRSRPRRRSGSPARTRNGDPSWPPMSTSGACPRRRWAPPDHEESAGDRRRPRTPPVWPVARVRRRRPDEPQVADAPRTAGRNDVHRSAEAPDGSCRRSRPRAGPEKSGRGFPRRSIWRWICPRRRRCDSIRDVLDDAAVDERVAAAQESSSSWESLRHDEA